MSCLRIVRIDPVLCVLEFEGDFYYGTVGACCEQFLRELRGRSTAEKQLLLDHFRSALFLLVIGSEDVSVEQLPPVPFTVEQLAANANDRLPG